MRRIRVAAGMSQHELAAEAKLPPTLVSMVETSSTTVEESALASIGNALQVSVDYLQRDIAEPRVTRPLLRAYADASKRHVDTLVEDSVTSMEAAEILGLLAVKDSLPLYDGDTNDEDGIEQFALEVRARLGVGFGDPIGNVIRAAERFGCLVLPLDSELGRHLGMSMRIDDKPVIRVSRSSLDSRHAVPGDRQRLTVAHELGHLALHRFVAAPNSPVEAAKAEREAYRFAGAFLAPGDAVREALDVHGGRVTLNTLVALKEQWGVAIKALVVRVHQLGIIDDDHARSLYKQISARRWNKSEPVPVEVETAVWWIKALEARYPGLDHVDVAARATGLDETYFRRWLDWRPAARADGAIDFVTESARRERLNA